MRPVYGLTKIGSICLLAASMVCVPLQAAEQAEMPVADKLQQLKSLIHKDTTDRLSVPPVYDRPLGSDAGPRVHVRRFIINGVNNYPAYGITQEKVDAVAERSRIELQSIHLMNEFGLTQQDLDVIGKRLSETLYSPDENLRETYGEILEQVKRDKKYREEMSIGQLQEVANRLTDYYRAAGFVIAQVYVPAQTVQNGIVYLQVIEGTLGNISVSDNIDYTPEVLSQRFEPLIGRTVQKESLENALLSLSDYPGLIAYGVLSPGENSGESELIIKVQEEQSSSWAARVENYGSELTGEYRLTMSYNLLNPLKSADELKLNLLAAFSPANTIYGDLTYLYPITGTDYLLSGTLSSNAYDIGGSFAAANVSGTVNSIDLAVSKQFMRSRSANLYGRFTLSNKTANSKVGSATITEDVISAGVFEVGFDRLDKRSQAIDKGTVKLTTGFEDFLGSSDITNITPSRTGGSGAIATSDFMKLNWELARLQLFSKYQNVLYRFSGQWTDDILVSVEQAGMGGPANVRALPVSEYLRDNAVFLSLDWNFNAPGFYDVPAFDNWKWGEILAFSVFADYGLGIQNDPVATTGSTGVNEQDNVILGGVGVAAQLLLPGQLQIRLDIGYPIEDPLDSDDVQFYFTLSYSG